MGACLLALLLTACSGSARDAAHRGDPIESCVLGACETCAENHCDAEHVEAVCVGGRCVERRGDPTGVSCEALKAEAMAVTLDAQGWVRQLRVVPHREGFAAVWTEPVGSPNFRNGVIGALVVGADGVASAAGVARIDGPGGKDTNPAIASTGEGLVVAWITERSGPELFAQRLDADGAVLAAPVRVSERGDEWVAPMLVPGAPRPTVLWVQEGAGEGEGLYHATLGPDLLPVDPPGHLPWVLSELEDMAAVSHGGRPIVAWPSAIRDLEGLYWTAVPPSDAPVHRLAEGGNEVDLFGWGAGFAAAWRRTAPGSGASRVSVHVQTFDAGGRALMEPQHVDQHSPFLGSPQVAYLGGVLVVTWLEQDDFTGGAPRRLMALQLDPAGRRLGPTEEVLALPGSIPAVRHVRVGENLLTVHVEPGASRDVLRLHRWSCSP